MRRSVAALIAVAALALVATAHATPSETRIAAVHDSGGDAIFPRGSPTPRATFSRPPGLTPNPSSHGSAIPRPASTSPRSEPARTGWVAAASLAIAALIAGLALRARL